MPDPRNAFTRTEVFTSDGQPIRSTTPSVTVIADQARIRFCGKSAFLMIFCGTEQVDLKCVAAAVDLGHAYSWSPDERHIIYAGLFRTEGGDMITVVSREIPADYRMSASVAAQLSPGRRIATLGPLSHRVTVEQIEASNINAIDDLSFPFPGRHSSGRIGHLDRAGAEAFMLHLRRQAFACA